MDPVERAGLARLPALDAAPEVGMTQAVAYRDSQNGQQEQSSGLIIHRGPLSAAVVRAIGSPAQNTAVWPRDGQGSGSSMELAHYPKQSSAIQSYDRETATWLPLYLYGSTVNLAPQGPGAKVTMPMGTAQALVGQYLTGNAWSLPQAAVWAETSVTVNVTLTGAPIRVEFGTTVLGQVGTNVYVGVGIDGTLTWPSLMVTTPAATNYAVPMSGVVYNQTPSAGAHRISLWMYATALPAALFSGGQSALFVTEIRA